MLTIFWSANLPLQFFFLSMGWKRKRQVRRRKEGVKEERLIRGGIGLDPPAVHCFSCFLGQ